MLSRGCRWMPGTLSASQALSPRAGTPSGGEVGCPQAGNSRADPGGLAGWESWGPPMISPHPSCQVRLGHLLQGPVQQRQPDLVGEQEPQQRDGCGVWCHVARPSVLRVGHPAHWRVLGWPGDKEQIPTWAFRKRGFRMSDSKQAISGARLLWNMPVFPSPTPILLPCGGGGCHFMPWLLPAGTPFVAMALASSSHGPFYTSGCCVGSWLV